MEYDFPAVGLSLVVAAFLIACFAFYCIYRLWKYGPFNANQIYKILHPFATLLSTAIAGVGVGIALVGTYSLLVNLIAAAVSVVLWWFALNFVCVYYAMEQRRKQSKASR